MLNIIGHLGDKDQNHHKIPLHTHSDGYNFFKNRLISVGKEVKKLELLHVVYQQRNLFCITMASRDQSC